MLLEVIRFELAYRLRRPATYIYFGIFFIFMVLIVAIAAGFFKSWDVAISAGGAGQKVHVNSPHTILQFLAGFSFFGVLITSAIMGTPVYRDFEHGTHSLIYTTPLRKWQYLLGRFIGSFIIALFVFSGLGLGFYLATLLPGLNPDRLGPNMWQYYLRPYILIIIPNLFITGAIFFSLATLTRTMLSNYIGSVVFLILYGITGSLLSNLDNRVIAAVLDIFGSRAVGYYTRYWTIAESNTLNIPFGKYILWNRLLWMTVGLAVLVFTFVRFRYSYFISEKQRKRGRLLQFDAVKAPVIFQKLVLPKVRQHFGFSQSLRQFFSLSRIEFKGVIGNIYFIAILFSGVVLMLVSGFNVGKIYDTEVLPATYIMIPQLVGSLSLFILIIITFYSGELVWRERAAGINQIYDTLPIPNWLTFGSKLTALCLVQVLLMLVVMVTGILLQAIKGYFHFELGLYIKFLFGIYLIDFLLLSVLAMLIQVLVNQKFLGHAVMILYYVFTIFAGPLGISSNLAIYTGAPETPYSAINEFGHFITPFFWFKLYWAVFAVLLALAANAFWVRGTEESMKQRFALLHGRMSKSFFAIGTLAVLVFAGTGSFIYYNTNILNSFKTEKQEEKEAVEYEKRYKKFENVLQPRIVDVNLKVDIYPKERAFEFNGRYILKNKTGHAIDSLHLNFPADLVVKRLEPDRPYKLVVQDKDYGYYIYRLSQPLQPGDSLQLMLDLRYETHGFKNAGSNTNIVYNGTFFNSEYLPSLGYDPNGELGNEEKRKKYGLPPKERMAPVNDLRARMNNYISRDADWVRFETVVSTVPEQIALAPGYLQKEWTENGRRYFHYKMDAPILNFYSFLSATYEIKKDVWKDSTGKPVNIEIYYHKGHEFNLDRMVKGVKKGLDYYTRNFSPYQHRQVRIVEFPGYQTFAQSFPNTIPFSESIGFIADVKDNDEDIDYPFYVTAHEVAHQWWAHQVIGGNVQGSTLMSETMAQYSALMVMEKEYGKDKMRKFLKYEMDNYLRGRSFEQKKEMPLMLNENQQYIHYNKGSVIMYALKDYIGEDRLNAALRNYIKAVAFQQPPYTNSVEFVSYLKAATPDSLQYIIHDMFETITLYDNRVKQATWHQQPGGGYKVTMVVESKKYRADSLGNETLVPMHDWVDIGLFPEKDYKKKDQKPLFLGKRIIRHPVDTFTFYVREKPGRAGIDPYNKLVDRVPDDNTQAVVEEGKEMASGQ